MLSTGAWVGAQPSSPPIGACCARCVDSDACTSFLYRISRQECVLDTHGDGRDSSDMDSADVVQGVPLVLDSMPALATTLRQRRLQETRRHRTTLVWVGCSAPEDGLPTGDTFPPCGPPLPLDGAPPFSRACGDAAALTSPSANQSRALAASLSALARHLAPLVDGGGATLECGPVCVPVAAEASLRPVPASSATDMTALPPLGTGLFAGWVFAAAAECYRAASAPKHTCTQVSGRAYGALQTAHRAEAAAGVLAAPRLCAPQTVQRARPCGEPQKHEECYAHVMAELGLVPAVGTADNTTVTRRRRSRYPPPPPQSGRRAPLGASRFEAAQLEVRNTGSLVSLSLVS